MFAFLAHFTRQLLRFAVQVEEEVEHVWSEVSSNAGSNSASVNVGRQCGLAEGVKAVMSEMERFKCSYCDVRMTSIAAILQHHCKQHSDDEFLWVDTTNNYTFTHSGEVSALFSVTNC